MVVSVSMRRVFACNPEKRVWLLRERRIDLYAVAAVFDDPRRIDAADTRKDYGEARRVTIGLASDRLFTIVYTMRGEVTWLITAWPSSRQERRRYVER